MKASSSCAAGAGCDAGRPRGSGRPGFARRARRPARERGRRPSGGARGAREVAADREDAGVCAEGERAVGALRGELGNDAARHELHPADGRVCLERQEPTCLRRARMNPGQVLVAAHMRLVRAASEPLVPRAREVPVPAMAGAAAGLEEGRPGGGVAIAERLDPHGTAAGDARNDSGARPRTGERASHAAATRSIVASSSGRATI